MDYSELLKHAGKVTLAKMKEYLEKKDWKFNREFGDLQIYTRTEQEHKFDEIVLPKFENVMFFQVSILDQIRRLAKFENREVGEVFLDFGIVVKRMPEEAQYTLAAYVNFGEPKDIGFIEGYATAFQQAGYLRKSDVKRLLEFVKPLQGQSESVAVYELEEFFKGIVEGE